MVSWRKDKHGNWYPVFDDKENDVELEDCSFISWVTAGSSKASKTLALLRMGD